ncbi:MULTISPECIES: hypothetical protein [Burkholderia cepacia complex]|uniref:Uncharacterized protein n=1 Tax=Burkholderia cepacia TaxID=292 RepID=A0A103Z8R3_BURCE|nr:MULTISPECIES: hypothetical protein [Burkholderia cepacia complex]KVC95171.1 hypothetical protein WI78_19025 [Burkholderia ubonensis]KVK75291.1 hypothetical protein WS90_29755 [Burkholderia cepacia]KVP55610.1 hypothetical protein WJ90_04910 [Burkholderia ubonensis]KVR50170.1 hypothetical protein WK16_31580 [Burkholderia ubonensis]KVT38426.1 hypothetical protein WK51_15235 [Burkholderia ubonensis]
MNANDQQAIEDAVKEIGLSMASNAFPVFYVAQNVYDTTESVWTVWNARESADEMAKIEAGIDLVFAVVGWVPVVGAGVKRTFRLVNHKSEIYGPLLFDILRLVLQRAHVQTSPDALIDKLFDATGVKKYLTEAREHIQQSWLYREMPSSVQVTFMQALTFVETNLPYWLGQFVQRKLLHWRKKQPNSSAVSTLEEHRTTEKPGAKGEEAKAGHDRPVSTPSKGVVNAKLAVTDITTEITGILGEHIGDYYCYEKLKWGNGWTGHDKGLSGKWSERPGLRVMGKLNDKGRLNKLFDLKARGHGIDGVWRAAPFSNQMKDFAIVEMKASTTTRKLKDPNAKHSIAGKLGTIKEKVRPPAQDLLEPPPDDSGPASPTAGGPNIGGGKPSPGGGKPSPGGGKPSPGGGKPTPGGSTNEGSPPRREQSDSASPKTETTQKDKPATTGPSSAKIARVQMSHEWIEAKISGAVPEQELADAILRLGYSRHLLYVPFYLPSAVQHVEALAAGTEHEHADHDLPFTHHYKDGEVEEAVKLKASRIK